VLQIFRSVVDDPVARCARPPAHHHRSPRSPELHRPPESANNNPLKRNGDVGQQPQRRPAGSSRSLCLRARWNRRTPRARVRGAIKVNPAHCQCCRFSEPAGRGWCITDDDRADRSQLWHQARLARGGNRLWLSPNLNWLVNQQGFAPRVRSLTSRSATMGHFTTTGRLVNDGETTLLCFASVLDCRSCPIRARCCPKMPARRIPRSIYEEARDVARGLAKTKAFEHSRRYRKKIEMLFAHLMHFAAWPIGTSRSRRRAVRVHPGSDCAEPSQAGKANRTTSADRANRVRSMSPARSF
jgi:hypothetical protein